MDKKEAMQKYGLVPLNFSGYYKYEFSFNGVAEDGALIYMSVGGSADDIYKFDVSPDKPEKLVNGYSFCSIKDKDGVKLFEESNW
jgi:hypothetical protein